MRILFDQGTPAPLRAHLSGHEVETAYEKGWSSLQNGDLLRAAEKEGFVVLVTTDTNLRYQQNLQDRSIGIVVLSSTSWPKIQRRIPAIVSEIERSTSGSYAEIDI